ncbi:MAG: hypothetical protein OXT01_14075, partial [Rhodospirillaceae bacterium]|nr:hypothetical protein [Rhodospirillaceae bacterium]
MVFPTASAEIHDNWQVAGLKGTGSCDFSVDNVFVPEAFSWEQRVDPPKRGGPLYRIEHPGFVANEHAGFAIGVGRRARGDRAARGSDQPTGLPHHRPRRGAPPAGQRR